MLERLQERLQERLHGNMLERLQIMSSQKNIAYKAEPKTR